MSYDLCIRFNYISVINIKYKIGALHKMFLRNKIECYSSLKKKSNEEFRNSAVLHYFSHTFSVETIARINKY